MTIFAGPFDSGNMNQPQWEEVESKVWRDGVIAGARNTFTVTTTTGLGISVNTGDAIVDGFRFYADATTPLTAAAADPSLPRIDLVVLRIDEAAHTSTIDIKTGTPAASPSAPTATKTVGGTYEVGIYQVRVNAGATSITSLTDVRTYAAPTNSAQLTGATFTGNVTVPAMLFGDAVSGQHAQLYLVAANNAATLQTPQGGAAALGVYVQTWDGGALQVPFSVGGQFGSAAAYVDNSGNLFANGLKFTPTHSGAQANILYYDVNTALELVSPQAGAATGVLFATWNGTAQKIPLSVGGQFGGALAYVDNSGHFHDATGPVLAGAAGLTGKFSAQSTAPTSPADGDLWLDTSTVLS